jgi:hypothetical protein
MKKIILILSLLPSLVNAGALKITDDIDLNYNGYIGYRYVTSSVQDTVHNSAPELGLTLSSQLTDNISLYTQFAYEEDMFNALKYSFMTFEKRITPNFEFSVKAGKLRHNFASFNEYRVNPRTRQGIIVPQAIYWDVFKHLVTSGTGVNINFKLFNQLELGYTIDDPEIYDRKQEAKAWSSVIHKSIDTSFGSHQLAFAKYHFSNVPLWVRATWTSIDLGKDTNTIVKFISYNGQNNPTEIITTGFQYNPDQWTFYGEAMFIKPGVSKWNNKDMTVGFSTGIKYDFENDIRVYTNYNRYHTKTSFSGNAPSYITETHDISVGVSYDYKDWLLGFEYHKVIGGRWLNPDDIKKERNNLENWDMFAANIVYFF